MQPNLDTKHRNPRDWSRRGLLAGLFAFGSTPAMPAVIAPRRTSRPAKRFQMISIHTGETIDTVYYRNGRYIPSALNEIDWFMRDWRTNQSIQMDIRAIDLWSKLHKVLRTRRPFELISGYRTPESNAILRVSSKGVAQRSLHMMGLAADMRLRGRTVEEIARAAVLAGAGGVGVYARSDSVHVDAGPNRHWEG